MEFETVYKQFEWLIKVNARKYARMSGEDEEELISLLNTEMWLIYQNFDKTKGKLETFLNISLQGKLLNYLNIKNNEFNRNAVLLSQLEEEDEDGSVTQFEIESDYNIFDHVLERNEETKTDEDKRQLISDLTRNVDSLTTAIVNEFLADVNISPTAIGRELGVHHQVVKRKLNALARKYSEREHGEIHEYLAV